MAADSAHSSRPAGPVGAPMPTSTMVPGPASGTKDMASGSGSTYEDLNGGLGPYNAKDRQGLLGTPGGAPSPGAGLLMLVALGAMVVVLRRRIT